MKKLLLASLCAFQTLALAQTPVYSPLSPPPSDLVTNQTTLPSSGGSVGVAMNAFYASTCTGVLSMNSGCALPTGWNGSTICKGVSNGKGQQYCSVNSNVTIPPNILATTCTYGLQAKCTADNVNFNTSQMATVVVAAAGSSPPSTGFGTVPPQCSNLANSGLTWQKSTKVWWLPYLAPVNVSNATDYKNIYGIYTATPEWPYASGGAKPTETLNKNSYLAMGFVVPASANGIGVRYFNVGSASPLAAATISECPGDFGQSGTHIVSKYCKQDLYVSGLQTWTGAATPGTCQLVVGKTYYLNMVDAQLDTLTTSTCAANTCNVQMELTY